MNIPEKVVVGGYTYPVKMVEVVNRSYPERIGEINSMKQEILIDKNLTTEQKESVFLHEVLHAIVWMMCIGLEENQIMQLERGLYMVLKENDLLKE